MEEQTNQHIEASLQESDSPDALRSEVKRPKVVWLILVWMFICLSTILQQLAGGYVDIAGLAPQTASQLNALGLVLFIGLLIGVGKLNKASCLIAGVLFALLTALLVITLSLNAPNFAFLQIFSAFLVVVVPTAMCAHWLLKPQSRTLYKHYAAYKHTLAMKKAHSKLFQKG